MELISRINWVDILCIILLLRISCVSFHHGLSHELFSLLGVLLTTIISLNYYSKLGEFLAQNIIGLPLVLANFLSFLVLMILILFVFRVFRTILDKIVKIQWHAFIDSVGGFIAGVARSFLTVSLVLILLILLPLPYMQWSIRDRSLTGPFFLKIGPVVYAKTYNLIPGLKVTSGPVDAKALIEELSSDKVLGPVKEKNKEADETPREE